MNDIDIIDIAMRRTSLTTEQAAALAEILAQQRQKLGYSIRQLASMADINLATIVHLERGEILTPQPDTLKALARALELSISDLFTAVSWLPSGELPSFRPYMRAKYGELPEDALAEMQRRLDELADQYGFTGPTAGEDER